MPDIVWATAIYRDIGGGVEIIVTPGGQPFGYLPRVFKYGRQVWSPLHGKRYDSVSAACDAALRAVVAEDERLRQEREQGADGGADGA